MWPSLVVKEKEEVSSRHQLECVSTTMTSFMSLTLDNKTVSIFDTDGQFLGHVGKSGSFTNPRRVAVDSSGRLYITDDGQTISLLNTLFPVSCYVYM